MKSAIAMGALALTALLGAQNRAFADSPSSFSVRSLSYAGSGCSAGTVSANVAQDLQAFTLLFDNYVAEVGPGTPFSASRRNCQLNISFDCPDGWEFALVAVDTRGFIQLDQGVSGTQKTAFYFQGDANTGSVERTSYGAVNQDYQVRDIVPAPSRMFGQCGAHSRSLNVNTQVRLDNSHNRNGRGLITVDSLDGSIHETFDLLWQRTSL